MDLTNSKNVNWTGLEEHFHGRSIDCIPTNAREWNKFRRQYENAIDFINGLPGTDPTKPTQHRDDANAYRNNILFLDLGYKRSPFEVLADYHSSSSVNFRLSEFAEYGVDWVTVNRAVYFFKYVTEVNIDYSAFTNPKSLLEFKFPRYIVKNFKIRNPELLSLEGSPTGVNGDFICQHGELMDLTGGPSYVKGLYMCGSNKISSLIGSNIVKIESSCDFIHNKITTLEGMPEFIDGGLDVSNNPLMSIDDGREGTSVVTGYIKIGNTPVSKLLGVTAFHGSIFKEMIDQERELKATSKFSESVKSYADFMISSRGGSYR